MPESKRRAEAFAMIFYDVRWGSSGAMAINVSNNNSLWPLTGGESGIRTDGTLVRARGDPAAIPNRQEAAFRTALLPRPCRSHCREQMSAVFKKHRLKNRFSSAVSNGFFR
jgi:hypothetical protein